ncbi:sensor histidine kinase [Paenibacillus sp. CGMCC 1.16610]|uniref:histidine kinase n=1 Tax=Paenibacillus anseongense TaxID=2682845 RepID=A0ABW9UGP7_9BACL|nr:MULTISPECIES: sensor histidine kinase [Paenibacillus]MBA2939689.1 sensor histidine kinase [Paenibacillus sp. CGMCC 1.16610]MVQ39349.1 HAMP domain-containing protein [Paenibacillus anseongense]
MSGFSKYIGGISIRNKIFIANILIIVVFISTQSYFANTISQKALIEKEINNSSRELVLIKNNLQTLIATIEDYSKILASDYRLQNVLYNDLLLNSEFNASRPVEGLNNLSMKKTLSETISNIVEPNTKIKAVSILTSNRHWVDVGFADNAYASRIFGDDYGADDRFYQPTWTSLIKFGFLYEGEHNVIAVSKSVIHKDTGKMVGRVFLYVKEATIASIYEGENKGGEFYIVDSAGRIISSQNKAMLYRDFKEAVSITIPENGKDTAFTQGSGKNEMLIFTQRFEPLKWTIVSVIPMDDISSDRKQINQLMIGIGAACLLLALIVSFLLSGSITRPIFQLAKTMREIRTGKMQVRSTYQSKDEIGYLSEGFNNLMNRIEALMAENVEKQRTKAEIEFKLLQSQVKPHFLYNTVETIISLIKLGLGKQAIQAAQYMANFYKISLSKGNDIISIGEEMRLTESYLEIQQLRYVEYMTYTMEIDNEILTYSIPKLTLQPIVENAIYHGLKLKKEKGIIRITGKRSGNNVEIEIYDNGAGMHNNQSKAIMAGFSALDEAGGFGIRSVSNRIQMLYGERYGLQVESEFGVYTKIKIVLPLRHH